MAELPTCDVFLGTGLALLDICTICLDPFSSTHVAVRFTSTNACCHVFGDQCLRKWLLSGSINANKCPTCRRQLFRFQSNFTNMGYGEGADDAQIIDSDGAGGNIRGQGGDRNESERRQEDGFSADRDDGPSYQSAHNGSAASTDMDEDNGTDGTGGVYGADEVNGDAHGRDEAEHEGEGGAFNTTNVGFANNLEDITDPFQAYLFVENLIQHLRAGGYRDAPIGRELRSLVRSVCHFGGIDTFPTRRSVKWRHMCSVIKRLQREVSRTAVIDDDIKHVWVAEMGEALDWHLHVHEEATVGF